MFAWIKTALKNAIINWKPLVGGVVASATPVINTLYPILPPDWQTYIMAAGIFWSAITVKQKNVTGGDVKQ